LMICWRLGSSSFSVNAVGKLALLFYFNFSWRFHCRIIKSPVLSSHRAYSIALWRDYCLVLAGRLGGIW
jgi:hypothetical protein